MVPFIPPVGAYQVSQTNQNKTNSSFRIDSKVSKNKSQKLHFYVKEDNIQKVLKLIKSGTDINETNSKKETALHIAIQNKSVKSMEMLIYLGANSEIKDIYGNTAKDLFKNSTSMQSKFDSWMINLYEHNIKTIVNTLSNIQPYLPVEIRYIIGNYCIDYEKPWLLEYDSTRLLEESLLLGDNNENSCCVLM